MAAGAVRERDALQDVAQNLSNSLLSRDVIGKAKGNLMERLKIGPEHAFDILPRSSNQLNEKLHAVALASPKPASSTPKTHPEPVTQTA